MEYSTCYVLYAVVGKLIKLIVNYNRKNELKFFD